MPRKALPRSARECQLLNSQLESSVSRNGASEFEQNQLLSRTRSPHPTLCGRQCNQKLQKTKRAEKQVVRSLCTSRISAMGYGKDSSFCSTYGSYGKATVADSWGMAGFGEVGLRFGRYFSCTCNLRLLAFRRLLAIFSSIRTWTMMVLRGVEAAFRACRQ